MDRRSLSGRFLHLAQLAFLLAVIMVFVPLLEAQQFSMVYAFTGADSLTAGTSLARDGFGNLYGASTGSVMQCGGTSCGAIYKITAAGQLSVLHAFQGPPDGAWPNGVVPVVGLSATNPVTLYGTTQYGGASTYSYCGDGCGTVFELTSSGQETVLHSFLQPPTDGIEPASSVIAVAGPTPGSRPILYGTTYYGGPYSLNGNPGEGTVYKIVNGTENVLYKFTGQAEWGAALCRAALPPGSALRDDGVWRLPAIV